MMMLWSFKHFYSFYFKCTGKVPHSDFEVWWSVRLWCVCHYTHMCVIYVCGNVSVVFWCMQQCLWRRGQPWRAFLRIEPLWFLFTISQLELGMMGWTVNFWESLTSAALTLQLLALPVFLTLLMGSADHTQVPSCSKNLVDREIPLAWQYIFKKERASN